jgi:hypothetical protein
MVAPMPENYPATPKPTASSTPVIQTEQKPVRNKFYKPALIALGIVLVIIISEVGYLVFKGYGETYFQQHIAPALTSTPAITSPTLEDIQASFPRNHISSDKVRDFADTLDHLAPKLEFIQSASLNFIIAGTLVESAPGRKEKEGIEYTHWMKLEANSGETITYLFTEQEIQTVTVFLFTLTDSSQINIREINRGDFVTIRSIANLLDPDPNFRIILEVMRE